MTSPARHYLNWFQTLAVDQRTDVAAIVGASMPGSPLSIDMSSEQLVDGFGSWIETQAAGSGFRRAALLLSLIAVTEFWIISRRDNIHGWQEAARLLNHLASKTGKDVFSQQAAQKDFQGRQWVSACDKWKVLRTGGMSDAAIDAWSQQSVSHQ